jgi:hypothetical protein
LAIVDGAAGGQDAKVWTSAAAQNYDRVRDEQLAPLGLTEAQVQAIWLKQADIQPTSALPKANADAYYLEKALGDIVRACKVRYPNLQLVFLSSRIYAGYAATPLNPEPYPGDIDGDGLVGIADLKILLNSWRRSAGEPEFDLRSDLNGDNRVDVFDLRILTSHWTKTGTGNP